MNKQSAIFEINIINFMPQIYQELITLKKDILERQKYAQIKYIQLDQFINIINVNIEYPRRIYLFLNKKSINESILKKIIEASKSKIKLISYPNCLSENFLTAYTKMQIFDKITIYKNSMPSINNSKNIKMIGMRRYIQSQKNLILTYLIVNGLRTKNKEFNDHLNSINYKYKNNPNIKIKEIQKIEDLLSTTTQKQILIVSHQDIQSSLIALKKINNRKQRIHSILYNTSSENKIVQICEEFDVNTSTVSQIIKQIEIYLTKVNIKNNMQVQKVNQEYFGMNTPNKQHKQIIEKSISPGGTSYRIRLNSARKYTKSLSGSQSSKSLIAPNILIFQNSNKEFIKFYQSLFLKPIFITSIPNNLNNKTIIVADYSDRKKLLNQNVIKNIGFIFYGKELQPDPVIVNPLVELATDNVQQIRNYLVLQNVKLKILERDDNGMTSRVFGVNQNSNIMNSQKQENNSQMKRKISIKVMDQNMNQIDKNIFAVPEDNKNKFKLQVEDQQIQQQIKLYKYQWIVKMLNRGNFFTFQKNSKVHFEDIDPQSKISKNKAMYQQIQKNQQEIKSNKSEVFKQTIKRVSDINKEKSSIKNESNMKSSSGIQIQQSIQELKKQKSKEMSNEISQVKKQYSLLKKNSSQINQKKKSDNDSQIIINQDDSLASVKNQFKKQESIKKIDSVLKEKNSQLFKKSQTILIQEIKQGQIIQKQTSNKTLLITEEIQKTQIKVVQQKEQQKLMPKGSIIKQLSEANLNQPKSLNDESSKIRQLMQADSIFLDEQKQYKYEWQVYRSRKQNQFLVLTYKQNYYQEQIIKQQLNKRKILDIQQQTHKLQQNHIVKKQQQKNQKQFQTEYCQYFDLQEAQAQSKNWVIIKKQKVFELLDQNAYYQYEKQKSVQQKKLPVKQPILIQENKKQQYLIQQKQNPIIQSQNQQIDQFFLQKNVAKQIILNLSQDIMSHIKKKKPETPGYIQNILRQSMNIQIEKQLKESKNLNESGLLQLSIIHSKNYIGNPMMESKTGPKTIVNNELINSIIYHINQQSNKYGINSIIQQQSQQMRNPNTQISQKNIQIQKHSQIQKQTQNFPIIEIEKQKKQKQANQSFNPNIKFVEIKNNLNFAKKNSYKSPKAFKSATSLTQPISQEYDAENTASILIDNNIKERFQNKKIEIDTLKKHEIAYITSQIPMPKQVNNDYKDSNNNKAINSFESQDYQTRIQNGIVITSKKQSNSLNIIDNNGLNNYYNININTDNRPVYYRTNDIVHTNKPQYISYDSNLNHQRQLSNQNLNTKNILISNQAAKIISFPLTNNYATISNKPTQYQQSPQKVQYGLNYTRLNNFSGDYQLNKDITPQKSNFRIINRVENQMTPRNTLFKNILYLIPQRMINETNKILTFATNNDTVQTFVQNEELKYIKYRDYNLVYIFQNDQKKSLPPGQNSNIYFVRINSQFSRVQLKSREIKIKDVEELIQISKTVVKKKSRNGKTQLIFKKLNPIIQEINLHFSQTEYKILKYYTLNELDFASKKLQSQNTIILITDQIPENIDIFRQYPYFTAIIIPKGKYKVSQTKYPKFKWIIQQNIQKILKQLSQYVNNFEDSALRQGNSLIANTSILSYNILIKSSLKDQINLQSAIPATIFKYFDLGNLKSKLVTQKKNIVVTDVQSYELVENTLSSKDKIIIYLKQNQIMKNKSEKILLTHRNAKQIVAFVKKLLQQNRSIRKQKTKIFYYYEQVEIESAVQKKFPFKFILIKYNDYSSLSRKISEFSNDNMIVIINLNLARYMNDIKNLKTKGRLNLIIYQRTNKISNMNMIRNVTELMNEIQKNEK